MPRTILILKKKLILNDKISTIQKLLNAAYQESGLLKENKTKVDFEEFQGGDKEQRTGLLNRICILYEEISDQSVGGHQRELHQYKYKLDVPAYKLQEAYVNYLNFVFSKYVTSKNITKQDSKTLDDIIDSEHVYVKEILIRLFTAAISIDKNNFESAQEATKIIDCLELFLKKINRTSIMYDKPLLSAYQVSNINIAFASEHKEWIYLLRQMQEVVESMLKHTAAISKLIEVLSTTKTAIAQQVIAYISKNDIPQESLLPMWVKYTLFECELIFIKKAKPNEADFYKVAAENYDSKVINVHQEAIIKANKTNNFVIGNLYNLLIKTNLLLAALDRSKNLFGCEMPI